MRFLDNSNHNPDSIYFLNSAQSIYINNFCVSFFLFMCTKIIQLLLYIPQSFFSFFQKIYCNVKRSSKLWTFFSMLIQSNIAILTFYSANQLLINGYFSFENKINFIICLLFLFFTLSYATSFYPLIYHIEKKPSA